MSKKYYVFCDSNCKYESMTKEQIIAAISQAVNEGKIGNIDTGFVTTIKTISGTPLKFFVGTQSEYELLSDSQKVNLFAIITNDTTKESLLAALEGLRGEVTALTERSQGFGDFSTVPKHGSQVNGHPVALSESGYYHIFFKRTNSTTLIDFGVVYWQKGYSVQKLITVPSVNVDDLTVEDSAPCTLYIGTDGVTVGIDDDGEEIPYTNYTIYAVKLCSREII